MIIHGIDMTKVNQPEYSKVYEKKMIGLLPEWERYFDDPFGRNLSVKKTKKFKDFKVMRSYMIFYKPKSALPFKENKVDMDKLHEEIIK
tara:strand:+ start:447 stop:713 length:267 start_codon:yes stop_codon:yes gene_type:complete